MASLQLVNISDPRRPKLIGSQQPLAYAESVAVQGDLALVAMRHAGLQLVNVSDPSHPKLIVRQKLLGYPSFVSVHGGWAMVATHVEGLQIVNIMQPTTPQIVVQIKTDSDDLVVVAQKNLALIGSQNSFKIIDLKVWAWTLRGLPPFSQRGLSTTILIQGWSVPDITYQKVLRMYSSSRPAINKPIRSFSMRPGQILSYRFANEFLDDVDYIIPFARIKFSQVGNHELPDWLGVSYDPLVSLALPSEFCGIVVNEDTVLVAARTAGLQLVNVSNPWHPKLIGNQTLPGYAQSIAVQGDVALVGTAGLQLVNVSNPCHPKLIGSLPVSAAGIAVRGDVALVAGAGLQLVNISDPRHPMTISSQALPGSARSVAVQGSVVLVAAGGDGLQLVNISDLRHPKLIGSQDLPGLAQSVAIQGNVALVADLTGLRLVNVSDPHHPKLIGSQTLRGYAQNVAVQENMVFIAANFGGLQVISIHHPQQPVLMDTIGMPGSAYCVTVRDNIAFVGTSIGLNLVRYGLSSAVLRGKPNKEDHKNYQIVITATNSDGIVGNTTFRISVNNPPIWKTPIAEKIVSVGQLASFQLPKNVFWDEDDDTLIFTSTLGSASPLPDWIIFFAEGQIYTIIPSFNNRGRYNISVFADDGYYGTAQAWFSLIVPTRKPVKISDIPTQNAFIWRPFELLVSSIFMSPDGDALSYRTQLKGARPLPRWLHFDNSSCATSCHFSGNPSITDLSDLEVELIATGLGGEVSAEFNIAMRTSTLFQDLITYYSVSGAGLVLLSLLARFWRWKNMRKIHKDLNEIEDVQDAKETQIIRQTLESQLKTLAMVVESQQTPVLIQCVRQYSQQAFIYAKNHQSRVLEVGDLWKIIKNLGNEIERRTMHKFNYTDTFVWVEALHHLLMLVIDTESKHSRSVMKVNKEWFIDLIRKVEKYFETHKKHGIQIKHQLQLCREALVSMDDTDSIKDNLCCRDSDMLLEIIKTMVVPPYGMIRLMYQRENIPSGWYPIIIQMCRLAEQALINSEKLSKLQSTLSRQKDWRVVYEGVRLLGKVARETQDEKIQKQAIEGIQGQKRGLNYYQNYRSFLRCSPCCDQQSAWIRTRAQAEVKSIDQDGQEIDVGISMNPLQQPLLQIQS